ncbi:MAG: hypothetical protein ABIQ16_25815 [Polyangiaceae bacterium]
MSLNEEDSIFEQALRGDLPSTDEQARLRKRLFAAGVSAGSSLAATSAASAQVGWGATVVAKVAALSWPVTLALGAAVATPIIALPIWLSPSNASHGVSTPAPVKLVPRAAPVVAAAAPVVEPDRASAPVDKPSSEGGARPAQRAVWNGVSTATSAPAPSTAASSALPAVAAFAVPTRADRAENARSASTLADETQLLDRAFAELAAGHRANAAALIAEHERRFPNGLLSQERERARARLEQNSKGE